MSLVFPTNPSNGDEYQGYAYDSTDNVWNRLPNNPEFVRFSETAPSNPQEGTLWFNTTVGKMFVYYNDNTSSQWVSAVGGIAGQSGTEGQMLIHDGTEWVAYDGGSRNLLYNGAMQVAQRGTSSTGITSGYYYTADRWSTSLNTLGTWTQTIEADGPTGSGFTKSLKMECTTADSSPAAADLLSITQVLEGQDLQGLKKGTSDAESLTISFWVKSNVTGTYVVRLVDQDNLRSVNAQYSIGSSDTWEKKTITFPGDTTGAFDNDNGSSLFVQFWLGAGSDRTSGSLSPTWAANVLANVAPGQVNVAASTSNYWQVTGVQLETGTVATPFEHKSYATELAECQRYYQKIAGGSLHTCGVQTGITDAQQKVISVLDLPVPLRTENSSITITAGTSNFSWVEGQDSRTTIGAASTDPSRVYLLTSWTGTTAEAYIVNINSDISINAEL